MAEIAKQLGINKIEQKKIKFAVLLNQLNTDNSIDLAADGTLYAILVENGLYKSNTVKNQ